MRCRLSCLFLILLGACNFALAEGGFLKWLGFDKGSDSPSALSACNSNTSKGVCAGSFTEPDGGIYVGEFLAGKYHGQGTYTSAVGKYSGEFKDGKADGYGVLALANGDRYVGQFKDDKKSGQGTYTFANGDKLVATFLEDSVSGKGVLYTSTGEVRVQGLWANNRLVMVGDSQSSAMLQRQTAKQTASIAIQATASQPDAFGEVTITIRTNADTSSLKLNGDELGGKADGVYTAKRVARAGQETKFTVVARDLYGNTDTKVVTVSRPLSEAKESFAELNAANLRPQRGRDAVAIIIGIQDYLRVPKAEFAKDDAQAFYDYALRLGIRPDNINMMLDSKADDVSIVKAFKNWLPSRVNKDKTDVYVFFSGHGLPSDDGKLYLLPYGVDKDLLERTAVAQKEVVNLLQAVRPKSVTMFIDSCYSGQTRGGEQLLASARPAYIKVEEKAYPDNFTVMSASASSQISSSSPDLKHGIFSYYLMKGLEGDADDTKDGTITIGKLQSYLSEKVPRFAMKMNRTQEPQLVGDSARVLVSK